MIGSGLSLDQAPPFEATGRFFITAPFFIILAGFVLVFKDLTLIRTDPSVVALIHIFTLGVFTMIMFGAISQMLPVLAGVSIPKALVVARLSHLFLILGSLLFIYGFLTSLNPFVLTLASIFLSLSFILVLGSALYALKNTQKFSSTVKAMAIAILSGLVTLFLGIWLLSDYIMKYSELHNTIIAIHMVWGVFGFAGILIIGVAFKIIPMFYVAPGFKKFCKKWVVPLVLFGIVLWTFLISVLPAYKGIALFIIATFFLAFSVTVLKKLSQRRRPVTDVTVWYWRLAGGSLFISMLLWLSQEVIGLNVDVHLAVLIGGGFILSILTGMLYKIVPFLVWFHLNALGHFEIPTMREMISARLAKAQFLFHVFSLVSLLAGIYFPFMIKLAGTFIIVSGILVLLNLLKAVKLYVMTKNK